MHWLIPNLYLKFQVQILSSNFLLDISIWISHRYLKFNMYKTKLILSSSCPQIYLLPFDFLHPGSSLFITLHPVYQHVLLAITMRYVFNLTISFNSQHHYIVTTLMWWAPYYFPLCSSWSFSTTFYFQAKVIFIKDYSDCLKY
jgi:hypothetical protein